MFLRDQKRWHLNDQSHFQNLAIAEFELLFEANISAHKIYCENRFHMQIFCLIYRVLVESWQPATPPYPQMCIFFSTAGVLVLKNSSIIGKISSDILLFPLFASQKSHRLISGSAMTFAAMTTIASPKTKPHPLPF